MKRTVAWVAPLLAAVLVAALLAGCLSWIKARFYIDHMESEGRLERLQVDRVVETLRLATGSVVADIGAGSGLFTRAMATEVAPGVVYAVDINENLLEHIERTANEAGLTNVKTVLSSERDSRLPEPIDLAFICDVLHLMDDPELYLKGLHAHVRPGGRVAIISFIRNWPPMVKQFTAEELENWMKRAGFALVERHDFIVDQYLVIYQRS
jgi:ubiquinone/menaquinone biosynthesis C-methylase UbiE